jgi:tripartite ATP-independent transporter DctM subunit
MTLEILSFVMLGVIVAAIVMGIPVAFALASVPLIFGYFTMGPRVLLLFPLHGFGVMTSYSFVAAPLFIFMGALMERSGIADTLYDTFYHLLGGVKGGLALATVAMATIFGACTGIVGAGVITIGLLALPSMLSRGYDKGLATGSIMVGGGLGVIIPPSIMLILYGCAAGVSISKLFVAAIVPGVLLGLLYMAYIYIRTRISPHLGPPISEKERIRGARLYRLALVSLLPPMFLILAVLGSVFFGIVSPSEAGAMGVLGAFLLVVVRGRLSKKVIIDALTSTMKISAAVLLICLAGQLFTGVFISLKGDVALRSFMAGFALGPTGTILMMLFIVLVLGCVMDWIALIFILVPIFGPIMTGMGIDALYFGILFCTTLQISNMTPPFAYSVFYLKTITPPEVTIGDMYRGCVPFATVSCLCPALVLVFPQIALWLPGFMN